jgi:hypothetical protein
MKPTLLKDLVFSEGGLSVCFVLPTVVYFFIVASIPSI